MLRKIWKYPLCTGMIVAINIIVFIISIFTGDILTYFGGVQQTAILQFHQYGRLVWAMFLHANTGHLFNNMIILLFLGAMLEAETGHLWFLFIYMASGIGGNILSLILKVMHNSTAISIGASGAVFGLDGLLLALVLSSTKFRERMSPSRVLLMVFLSLYEGYRTYNVDNAAHFGGLVIGFALGLLFVFIDNITHKHREVQF